ncbi:MAG: MFS transporter [Kutzneria sp.]|nr:MFS transporter [Kutzneria sp.]
MAVSTTLAGPDTTVRLRPQLTAAGLITVLLGGAFAPLDLNIVNVALPTVGASLGASTTTLEWVVAAYSIAFALLLVVGGRLGDAMGRRRLFTVGLAAFTLTSLICGLAPDITSLVLARAAQGAAAALMIPQVLSIIQATTAGERRALALGYYGATGGISMAAGQVLGAVLVSANLAGAGWRPIFLVNVPIGIVGVLLARRTLPETKATDPLGVDRLGTGLLGLAVLTLLVPLLEGRTLGWPVWCWMLLGLAPVAAVVFVATERRVERRADGVTPLLPLSVLRMPTMRRGLAIAVPFFAGFGGFLFVYAIALQDGLHLTPFVCGLALSPMAVGFLVSSLLSSGLVARFGHWVVIAGGATQFVGLAALAGAILAAWPDLTVLDLAPGTLLAGAGQGLIAPTLYRVTLSKVPSGVIGVGSGMLVTTQQVSFAFGVAILGSLFVGLSGPGSLGMGGALVLVVLVQCVLAVGITVLARGLPDPRS